MEILRKKDFGNGSVYCLELEDGCLIETTDTFLPYETINCDYSKNVNDSSRSDRWMIGVSVMSGCPIRCKFCATGQMKKYRNLTCDEIVNQVFKIANKNLHSNTFGMSKENKINYTRMGEPFLNIEEVKKAIKFIDGYWGNVHHFVSTIGIKGSDFSWIEDDITLQLSVHSLDENRRRELIPYNKLMSLEELGQIRTKSKRKTTVNLSLVDEKDFDIEVMRKYFDPEHFFIKLSPINKNTISEKNDIGNGVIDGKYS